jgi:hypothetical protein
MAGFVISGMIAVLRIRDFYLGSGNFFIPDSDRLSRILHTPSGTKNKPTILMEDIAIIVVNCYTK